MARFEQLRWVPMLIQAYYRAQTQLGTTPAITDKNSYNDINVEPKTRSKKPMPESKHPVKQNAGLQNPVHPNPIKLKNPTQPSHTQNDSTQRLLREIRSTNKKLKNLDMIHKQLKEISTSLDHFNQRIEELKIPTPIESPQRTQVARFQEPIPPIRYE